MTDEYEQWKTDVAVALERWRKGEITPETTVCLGGRVAYDMNAISFRESGPYAMEGSEEIGWPLFREETAVCHQSLRQPYEYDAIAQHSTMSGADLVPQGRGIQVVAAGDRLTFKGDWQGDAVVHSVRQSVHSEADQYNGGDNDDDDDAMPAKNKAIYAELLPGSTVYGDPVDEEVDGHQFSRFIAVRQLLPGQRFGLEINGKEVETQAGDLQVSATGSWVAQPTGDGATSVNMYLLRLKPKYAAAAEREAAMNTLARAEAAKVEEAAAQAKRMEAEAEAAKAKAARKAAREAAASRAAEAKDAAKDVRLAAREKRAREKALALGDRSAMKLENEEEYAELCHHFFDPVINSDARAVGGRLRKAAVSYSPARIDLPTPAFKALRVRIAALKKEDARGEILGLLRQLRAWEIRPPSLGGILPKALMLPGMDNPNHFNLCDEDGRRSIDLETYVLSEMLGTEHVAVKVKTEPVPVERRTS